MITTHLLSTLIISVILVQISWTKPTPEDAAGNIALLDNKDLCHQKNKYSMELSVKDSLLSSSGQLLKFTLKAFQEFSLQYVEKAKNISEQLLKNGEIQNSKSAKILEFKQNLTQFEQKYSLCDGLDELFELVELYSNTTSIYYELEEALLDADGKLILSLLRKYGSEDLDEEGMNMLIDFVARFDKKFADLKEDLSKEEGKIGKDMLKWYEDFKALPNFDDKIVAFEEFFLLYEEEE